MKFAAISALLVASAAAFAPVINEVGLLQTDRFPFWSHCDGWSDAFVEVYFQKFYG